MKAQTVKPDHERLEKLQQEALQEITNLYQRLKEIDRQLLNEWGTERIALLERQKAIMSSLEGQPDIVAGIAYDVALAHLLEFAEEARRIRARLNEILPIYQEYERERECVRKDVIAKHENIWTEKARMEYETACAINERINGRSGPGLFIGKNNHPSPEEIRDRDQEIQQEEDTLLEKYFANDLDAKDEKTNLERQLRFVDRTV